MVKSPSDERAMSAKASPLHNGASGVTISTNNVATD
jgi:hypothetical protein